MSTNAADWLHIRYPNGSEGHVLPEDFADPKKAENFKDARVISRGDGTEYHGPTTPEGLARKDEREEEPGPATPRRQAAKE